MHFIDDYSGVFMPVWTPPTPPREGSAEFVTDPCLSFLYETPTIPENHLPPTHCLRKNGMDLYAMKRNTNRTHYMGVFKKKRHRLSRPKSIFDKKALEILNKNKLKKSQKLKQKAALAVTPASVTSAITPAAVAPVTAARPDTSQQGADWIISEDWALLQAINLLSELPLDFQSEAVNNKLANWELASDVVNIASRIHRSSKQCRERFQNVVVPREEGKNNSSITSQKTHSQFNQDHGKSVVSMHYAKFDSVKMSALKRKPTVKQSNSSKILGSSRHTQILTANGIVADKSLNPRELATMRAERIAKEKAQAVVAAQQLQQNQTTTASTTTTTSQVQVSLVLTSRATLAQPTNISVAGVNSIQKGSTASIIQAQNRGGNLVFTSANAISSGSSSLVVNPSVTSAPTGLTTTAASFAAINRKMQNVSQNAVSLGQLPIVSATGASRILGTQSICQTTQMLPGLVQSKLTNQTSNSFTVAVSSVSSSVVAPNLVTQVQRGATIAGTVVNPGKTLNQHHIALLRQKAQQQQQQQQLQKIQQQRIQQQKQQQQQQLKLLQQQQQQQPQTQTSQSSQQSSSQSQAQATKQVQPTLVATTNQLGTLTVQTMKAPVTLRGSVPQQIVTQGLTQAQQQQLVQQALKKQQYQQLQQRAGQSQIQQMLAGQKLTQHQLQQLQQQQQQRQSQLQQQQQLKFQQQVTATIVTQPKTQLVMTQVKPGQSVQSLKTSGQQIQLQQIQQTGSIQTSLPQQILLRPTLPQGTNQAQFQGLPQQIQLRAMISQQSAQQMQRVNAGQQLQAMQAQVNLQTGTVVMQPQQSSQSASQQLSTAQVHVVSSLAQQQQRNIQAAVQKQVQQQQQQQQQHHTQLKVTSVSTGTTKSAQVQLQFQQPSQQLRHQVLSATPAQLSQVKAFVSQAQLQASLSRSNSPVGAGITTTPNSIVPQSLSSSQVTSIQLQAQQVSQQIRSQAQMVQVQLKTSTSEALSTHQSQQQSKQQQLKQQLQQLQTQAAKQQQQLRQTSLTTCSPSVIPQRSDTPKVPKSPLAKPDMQMEVETLGAETELSADGNQEKEGDSSNLQG